MKNNNTRRGFTLIELLVVVLIIGVLAAVALPQYQKAVTKAKLTKLTVPIKTTMDAVDLWLLENGGQLSSMTHFLGNGTFTESAMLDIEPFACKYRDSTSCYTDWGYTWLRCGPSSSSCTFEITTSAKAKADGTGTETNPQHLFRLQMYRNATGWHIDQVIAYGSLPQELLCTWWKDSFGEDTLSSYAKSQYCN